LGKKGNTRTKISKAFATEGTEASEVLGPKDKGQIQRSGKAYWGAGKLIIFAAFISLCSLYY
jgi:hypothetical protein